MKVLGGSSSAWATWSLAVASTPRAGAGDETASVALGMAAGPAEILGAWYARARSRLEWTFTQWFDPAAVGLVEAVLGRGSLPGAVETYAAARRRAGLTNDDLLVDLTSLVAVLPEAAILPGEGLATRAGLERALSRLYGDARDDGESPSRTHALVVVDVLGRGGRPVAAVAERMRADLPLAGPVSLMHPHRLAGVVDRRVGMARGLAALRSGLRLDPALAAAEALVRVERLPLHAVAVAQLLDFVAAAAPAPPSERRPRRLLAAALAVVLVTGGVAAFEATESRRRSVLEVAGRAGQAPPAVEIVGAAASPPPAATRRGDRPAAAPGPARAVNVGAAVPVASVSPAPRPVPVHDVVPPPVPRPVEEAPPAAAEPPPPAPPPDPPPPQDERPGRGKGRDEAPGQVTAAGRQSGSPPSSPSPPSSRGASSSAPGRS